MKTGGNPLDRANLVRARLAAVKSYAMFGDVPPSVHGIVHCLDGLLSSYPDFDGTQIEGLLHRWVRQVQVVDLVAITDAKPKAAVKMWVKARSGTDFHAIHEMRRILQLVVVPLAEARRGKVGAIGTSLASLLESSVPESTHYVETSRQKPLHPGLYAAVLAVEAAHQAGRLPRLCDIVQALKKAGIQGGTSSAKRYAKRLRDAGVEFNRTAGRRRGRSTKSGK